jgi:hypothetical protein
MSRGYAPRSLRSLRKWPRHLYGKEAAGLGRLMTCWRHRLYPDRAFVYDFETWRPDQYLPDGVRRAPDVADASYGHRTDDKVVFFLQMRAIGAPTPEVVAENVGGRLIFYAAPHDYEALLAGRGELVIKPRNGMQGGGVRIVKPGDADRLPRSNEFASIKVVQHPYAAAIYPHAVNTVRLVTAWDADAGAFFVMAAAHRFGTSTSGRVDNWSAGGVAAGVNLETGALAPAIRQVNFDRARTWWPRHPDTGAPIEGVVIPHFERMRSELLQLCRHFPQIFVGWDVVITEAGWTVLEANRFPALNLFQLHRPLLVDPRTEAFFRREKMI